MKKLLFLIGGLLPIMLLAQSAYEIKVTLKPFRNQYIYLGHYFGKTYPIIDSVKLNENSEGVFRGDKKLQGGIYLIGFPSKSNFFEMLVDKQQKFSILADTTIAGNGVKFVNSPDNTLFSTYQQFVGEKGSAIFSLKEGLKNAKTKADTTAIVDKISVLDEEMNKYREQLIAKNPEALLTTYLIAMREPTLTGVYKNPVTKEDSTNAFNFYKSKFWEGVNFWDGRLAYTTFFEDKLDKYFQQLVAPNPDTIIKEIDKMMSFATINEEMTRFLLVKFINRYYNQKYMWEDAIFVHLFEKYFANKKYSWLSEAGKKNITERAYSLMANIFGSPASEVQLPDSTGKIKSLYSTEAPYTLVVFWDPMCGHCKETLPRIDSIYRAKWKAENLKIFAVAKENEGTPTDWKKFISEKKLEGWVHVYYSKAAEKSRVDGNLPGYSQLYDVQQFPTLYLLDKDKRIVAKKLSFDQIDEILQLKKKGL
jgi:thiol-disulfide isomerase/thioredoxin